MSEARKGKKAPDRAFYEAMAKFLEKNGWVVMVAGPTRIVGRGERGYNYTFEVDFTGIQRGRKK